MNRITRRASLATAGTLAALLLARKPHAEGGIGRTISDLTPVRPREKLPPIQFTASDGTTHALGEYLGRGVVLNFWATWCVPCVAELPSLDRLAAELDDSIAILALSSDRGGAPVVEKFYDQHGIKSLGVWLDPRGDATQALKLRGIPTTLILDRQGLELGRIEGAVDWAAPGSVAAIKTLIG